MDNTQQLITLLRREKSRRSVHFPSIAATDTAFALMLEAADFQMRGEVAPATCLGLNAAIPHAVACRHLQLLSQAGFIERKRDPFDGRVVRTALSNVGERMVFEHLASVGRLEL